MKASRWVSGVLLAVAGSIAWAQAEFPTAQGNNQRAGLHNAPNQTNNPGRGNLRWWDPLLSVRRELDNDDLGTSGVPPARWLAPNGTLAFLFEQRNLLFPPYRYAFATASRLGGEPNEPQDPAQLATYSWTFAGTQAGQEYALYANLPIGPTDVDPSDTNVELRFPQRRNVYEIRGVDNPDNPGQPVVVVVDALLGGLTRLGGETLYTADGSGTIEIRLLNTIPRDGQGVLFDDPRNRPLVYADLVAAVRAGGQLGDYVVAPVVANLKESTGPFPWRVVSARNEETTVQVGSEVRNYNMGVVTSFAFDGTKVDPAGDLDGTGRRNIVWSWPARRPFEDSVAERSRYAVEKRDWVLGLLPNAPEPSRADIRVDLDDAGANATVSPGWTVNGAVPGSNRGINFLTAPAGSVANVVYRPSLVEGVYQLYAWLPDNVAGLATDVTYEIYLGGTPGVDAPTYICRLDQENASRPGWVRLNTGFPNPISLFRHTQAARLQVRLNAQTSIGGTVYGDAIRFQSSADLSITSTPVMVSATVELPNGAGPARRDVVLVASNNGRLYCLDARGTLDATGEPTGETIVYWAYPSEMPANQADPNQAVGLDGPNGGVAEMPIGFDLTSALVQTVPTASGPRDILYIGSLNGRVYAIDMAGRGDAAIAGDGTQTRYGTTVRRWSYPDDYPQAGIASTLGNIRGSVAYRETAAGPTLFVTTTQGRLYALDAAGDDAAKTTSVRWAYPLITDPTLGAITMSPVAAFGNVYFGSANATFYAVNEDTGLPVWTFAGSVGNPTLAFGSSAPAAAPAGQILGNAPSDTVFVANNNQRVYALNAQTGGVIWETPEMVDSPGGPLSFTWMSVYDQTGIQVPRPVVLVPTVGGKFNALFARAEDVSREPTRPKLAWAYIAEGQVGAGMAVGGDLTLGFLWLYGVDRQGYLYAFNDNDAIITPGDRPGQREIVPNDPTFDRLRAYAANGKVSLMSPEDYEFITRSLSQATGLDYAELINRVGHITRDAYEYGEGMYVVVYDIPNPANFPGGDPLRQMSTVLQFTAPGSASTRRQGPIQGVRNAPQDRDGIAIFQFPIIGVGNNALSPGLAALEVSLTTGGQQGGSVRISPATPIRFGIANPLAVETRFNRAIGNSIGLSLDPKNAENVNNGNLRSPDNVEIVVKSSLGPDEQSPGEPASHGQAAAARVLVYDRSLMALLINSGLSNVRFQTADLAWQGGVANVYKPMDGARYPLFEELPTQFPNVSLDYPDLRRDSLKISKESTGAVENPLFAPVTLKMPDVSNGADVYRTRAGYNVGFLTRRLIATDFDLVLTIPRFQPPNRQLEEPEGPSKVRGYDGLQYVYVDANQPGRQFAGGVPQEAYRQFNLMTDVAIDERIEVTTPVIDMGSMPAGAGFDPRAPFSGSSTFDPWLLVNGNRVWGNFFRPFRVQNVGNVNLLNVRVAKAVERQQGIGTVRNTIPLQGVGMHERSWLDAPLYLYSDIDWRFAPVRNGAIGRAAVQKSRPGDASPSQLSPNPVRRGNANIGAVEGTPLVSDTVTYPVGDPRIGVTVPIGTPSGTYQQQMLIFEDRVANEGPGQYATFGPDDPSLDGLPGGRDPNVYEPYAEPGFLLKFTVRETRATTAPTPKAAPMLDLDTTVQGQRFFWSNGQPAALRDANGHLIVVFASNRLGAGDRPLWNQRPRDENDTTRPDQYRLYVGSLYGSVPGNRTDGVEQSPLRDLNRFREDTSEPRRWFRQYIGNYPGFPPPNILFGAQYDERIENDVVNYGSPVFPTSGVFDPLTPMTDAGRQARNRVYMAFLGEAVKRSPRGERTNEVRLFISRMNIAVDGRPTFTASPNGLRFDPNARVSRPAIVQNGDNATVFYTRTAAGTSQLCFNTYLPGRNAWGDTRMVETSNAFESFGAPAATLRRYRHGDQEARIDLLVTAKLRGRAQTEAYLVRFGARSDTGAPAGRNPIIAFPVATYPLSLDPASSVYWGPGADWRVAAPNLDRNNLAARIDVLRRDRRDANGRYESILDYNTAQFDQATRILAVDTRFGGRAYIDTGNGSVRFAGAVIPRNIPLVVQCGPVFLRVSASAGSNYRGAAMVFDERFIGEFGYWANGQGQQIGQADLVRSDRFLVTYARTSGDGSQPARPFMRSLRFGIQLPTAVQTDAEGRVVGIQVRPLGGSPAVPFFQVDPTSGRLYFMAENEDGQYEVTYRGVDENGAPYGSPIVFNGTVVLQPEMAEVAIPIEQVANESGVALALDPQNQAFNSQTERRNGLIWTFWSSTRAGSPDVYFQTIAPKFAPRAPGQ